MHAPVVSGPWGWSQTGPQRWPSRATCGHARALRGGRNASLWLCSLLVASIVSLLPGASVMARSHRSSSASASSPADDGDSQDKGKNKGKSKGRRSRRADAKILDAAFIDRINAILASRDFAAAARQLGDAYRRDADPEILFHLGRVAAAEGKLVEAQDLMRRYLADPDRVQEATPTGDDAQKVLRQARPAAGEVSLLADPGALVVVDDRPIGVLPLPQPLLLPGGLHNLTLEYASRKLSSPVQVVNGRLIEMRFNAASAAVVFTLRPALLVVPSATTRGLPDLAQRSLGEQFEQTALAERMAVMPLDVALGAAPKHKDCLDQPGCQRDLARDNKAEFVISYTAQSKDAAKGPSWQFDLTLLHTSIREPAATASKVCGPCTLEQASSTLKDALALLLQEGLRRKRGTVELSSEPPGAEVRTAAGEVLGKTPLSLSLWEGSYDVALALPGFTPEKRRIDVGENKRVPMAVAMQPDAPEPAPAALIKAPPPPPVVTEPPKGREPRPTWRLATGITAMGLGLGLVGFGLSGVLLEDQCVRPPMVLNGTCRVVYNSAPTGGGIMLGGVALTLAGVILVAIPGPRRK